MKIVRWCISVKEKYIRAHTHPHTCIYNFDYDNYELWLTSGTSIDHESPLLYGDSVSMTDTR